MLKTDSHFLLGMQNSVIVHVQNLAQNLHPHAETGMFCTAEVAKLTKFPKRHSPKIKRLLVYRVHNWHRSTYLSAPVNILLQNIWFFVNNKQQTAVHLVFKTNRNSVNLHTF